MKTKNTDIGKSGEIRSSKEDTMAGFFGNPRERTESQTKKDIRHSVRRGPGKTDGQGREFNSSSNAGFSAGNNNGNNPSMGKKFCTLCGNEMEPGSRFCLNCGADMGSSDSEAFEYASDSGQDDYSGSLYESRLNTAPRTRDTLSRTSRSNNAGRVSSTGRQTANSRRSGNMKNKYYDYFFGNGQSKELIIAGTALFGVMLLIFVISGLALSGSSKTEDTTEATSEVTVEADERSMPDVEEEEVSEQPSEAVVEVQDVNVSDNMAVASVDSAAATIETASTADSSSENSVVEAERKTTDEKVYVIAKDVRIRPQPSTDGEAIATVNLGTELYRYEKRDDGWSHVDYNNQEAYVKTEFLGTESEYAALKKQEEDKAKAEAENAETTAVAITDNTQQAVTQDNGTEAAATAMPAATAETVVPTAEAVPSAGSTGATTDSGSGGGSTENTQMSSDGIVYITPTGKAYHYDKECAGKNAIPKNFSEVSSSYKPCGTCVIQ